MLACRCVGFGVGFGVNFFVREVTNGTNGVGGTKDYFVVFGREGGGREREINGWSVLGLKKKYVIYQ